MAVLRLGLFLCLVLGSTVAVPDVVPFQNCPDDKNDDGSVIPRNCDIHSLTIDKCIDPQPNTPCKIKRTKNAVIQFTYTVGTELQNATSRAYWNSEVGDLPLAGMDTHSCNFTPCPIPAGQENTFSQNLPLSKKFPMRVYDVKWKLENEEHGVKCCFIFTIKLVK